MNWYETAFRREYLDLYYHRDDASAKQEAEFAVKALALPDNARILDIACGGGRHARALEALGHDVVGLDLSRDLLEEANGVTRVRGDMRALPFAGTFDAATSFFTSFGYFDEAGNQAVLQTAAAALRPGGVYLLDYLNALVVRTTLVPQSEEERNGSTYSVRRRIEGGRVIKDVSIEREGETVEYTESVRLYIYNEIVDMLIAAGLDPVVAYGDFDGRDFTTDSPRCIVIASRPSGE
ncbi:MAG: class I SAM-dependent methyltransferase [Planctomycetota bacterium]|jgi:SAM-dependent methyltransferase